MTMTHEDMARELQAAGWRVQPPLTQENCKHELKSGNGGLSSDGSGFSEWSCPACGKRELAEWPARPGKMFGIAWNGAFK
jgi:hypothetical protein